MVNIDDTIEIENGHHLFLFFFGKTPTTTINNFEDEIFKWNLSINIMMIKPQKNHHSLNRFFFDIFFFFISSIAHQHIFKHQWAVTKNLSTTYIYLSLKKIFFLVQKMENLFIANSCVCFSLIFNSKRCFCNWYLQVLLISLPFWNEFPWIHWSHDTNTHTHIIIIHPSINLSKDENSISPWTSYWWYW